MVLASDMSTSIGTSQEFLNETKPKCQEYVLYSKKILVQPPQWEVDSQSLQVNTLALKTFAEVSILSRIHKDLEVASLHPSDCDGQYTALM